MKKFNIYITMGLTALVAVTSCKKINVIPVFEIAETQSFNTINDAKAWDNGIYSIIRPKTNGQYSLQSDVATDQLDATLDYGNNYGAPHRWDASYTSSDQTVTPIWSAYYSAIANVNLIIANFPSIQTTTAADAASLKRYTGDAYLARAWYYHKLVLKFAKPYETASANSDLGVPLVLKFDITVLPARATVAAVYTQILSDIAQAEALLAPYPGGNTAALTQYFTIDAAKALEARVRLYMHDDAGAYAAANSLITGAKYPLINTAAGMLTYWRNDGSQESITQFFANNTTDVPNSQGPAYIAPISATNYDPEFVPNHAILDLYNQATDIRFPVYFNNTLPLVIKGTAYPGTFLMSKFQGNPALFTGTLTNGLQAPKVFRIGEMYCIAAEAASNLAQDGNALLAINPLRVARGEAALVSAGAILKQDIRDERTREMAFEDTRFTDLKRWHLGFTRGAPQNTNMLVQGTGYVGLTIAADANDFTWPIPFNDTSINPNLVQNPGW